MILVSWFHSSYEPEHLVRDGFGIWAIGWLSDFWTFWLAEAMYRELIWVWFEDVSQSPRLAILETEWYIVIYSDHEINSTWTMCIMSQESKEIEDILEAHEEMKQEMKQKMRSARWRSANLQSKRSMRSEVQPSTDYSDYLPKELMGIDENWAYLELTWQQAGNGNCSC